MCTITFIPAGNKTFITSNRDEKFSRPSALVPDAYQFPGGKVFYPKDTQAGGTWFAMHENGNVVVLMNGAFVEHTYEPPYRHSRGLVVLKLIQHESPLEQFKLIDLFNVEPFTVIIYDEDQLIECRWDGAKKHLLMLDKTNPYIWSSSTLYKPDVINKREEWFADWIVKNTSPTHEDILNFHQFTGDGDRHNALMMNRDDQFLTVSITGLELNDDSAQLKYHDLKSSRITSLHIGLKKECARR